jgi:hypothetical protein
MSEPPSLALALRLAARGWHILPLSAASKRPLGNCPDCAADHKPDECPCLAAGRWCHGVRAATTDPAILTAWWQAQPRAIPGAAAGPSGLVLLDIDAHNSELPPSLATGLLPGIDLATEPVDAGTWNNPGRFHDGRDTLALLARLRGGPRPWPTSPEYQPVTAATPSGGIHLWYQAPATELRQMLSDPAGRYGLAWQVDIKAGWSYGIAPSAVTAAGTYQVQRGNPGHPGRMPDWLARETIRAAAPAPRPSGPPAEVAASREGPGSAAYLNTVINRGTAQLALMKDGRKRALSALAFHAGGLLTWSGLDKRDVTNQLIRAGTTAGVSLRESTRIVTRAFANGVTHPITPRG